ncbi:MAG TPA: hypothetical protein VF799_05200 [Geobacteraceae bacterium]
MKKLIVPVLVSSLLLGFTPVARAGMIKAYYAGVTVSGAQGREDMSAGLKALLASRLNSDLIFAVDTPGEADIVISGNYVSVASVFSMVAMATARDGRVVARVSVQGEGGDEQIPAVGRLARELADQVRKAYGPPR